MMQTDAYGNTLSTKSADAVQHYDAGVAAFLGGEAHARASFAKAVQADPSFALGHVGLARASMMSGDMPAAQAAIAEADALAAALTDRERAHIGAFQHLLSGRPGDARAATRKHVRDHPRDALVAQMCTNVFGLIGFSGETAREAELLAYTTSLMPHYVGDWWMMSMQALSLCECGEAGQSLDLMEESLALNPRNANGAHFKAHALYELGDTSRGRAYLSDWMTDYDATAVLHGHLSWHSALWALHDGEIDAVWAETDAAIGVGGSKGLPINTLTDTAAIYHRAALMGYDVTQERWKTLSAFATQFFPNPGQSFADMHAALAHAMAGDGDALAKLSESPNGFAGDLVAHIAKAWAAIARQDWPSALTDLTPVMADHVRIGGSRAQRDLLELTYVHVLMRLGLTEEAERSLRTRRPVFENAMHVAGMVH